MRRSQISIIFSLWAIIIIVTLPLRLLTDSAKAASVAMSSALVASSRISIFGLRYKALAMAIRCL